MARNGAVLAAIQMLAVLIATSPVSHADEQRAVNVDDPVLRMVAFTGKIPKAWKFTGMIAYPRGCHPPQIPADGLTFTALAPDGVTAVEKLPGESWDWNSDGSSFGKCKPVKLDSAASFLLNIALPNMRPDAKEVTVVPLPPKLQEQIKQDNQQQPQGGNIHRHIDAARVHVAYTYNGKPVEEMLFVVVACQELDMPAYPMLHRAANQRHVCRAGGVNVRRAPKGALDALTKRDDLPPMQIDAQWDAAVSERMRTQFAAMQKASDEQFRAIQNHFKDQTNQMLANGRAFQEQQRQSFNNAMAQDRATQAAIDHSAQMQVRNSLNRQDFINPTTGQRIETSDQYTHNWISADGQSVVLNGDSTFDPNGVIDPVRQSWTELIPVN